MASSLVTLARKLLDRKARRRLGLAPAEGVRLIEEALASAIPIAGALVDAAAPPDERREALEAALIAHGVPVERVDTRTFAELSDTAHSQGILAAVQPPMAALSGLAPARGRPVLVLDRVQDPGNVGTLLRTAWGVGAAGAVLLKGTADPLNGKVVRAAMGATFRLPLAAAEPAAALAWARETGVTLWVAVTDGHPVAGLTVPARLAVVVGNEGAGLDPVLEAAAERRVGIPLRPGVESLNVAVAAAILLYEVAHATA